MKTCAITGHRVFGAKFSNAALYAQLQALIEQGYTTFYCGMAIGFDLQCAEFLLLLRDEFPQVRLIACIPCEDQSDKFSKTDQLRYRKVRRECDEEVVLHPHYVTGCMLERNRYMVDRADILFAYLERMRGGTYYTVHYAQERGIPVQYYKGENKYGLV